MFTITAVMRPYEGNYDVDCPADSNYCGDSDEEDPERLLDVWLGELDSLASVNIYIIIHTPLLFVYTAITVLFSNVDSSRRWLIFARCSQTWCFITL